MKQVLAFVSSATHSKINLRALGTQLVSIIFNTNINYSPEYWRYAKR